MTLSPEQLEKMQTMKSHFPFRIVCGCLSPDGKKFEVTATATMHRPNALVRKGWTVFKLQPTHS